MLDAEAIFWFASTIAQCVVALLAFAAFLAVWRLASITESRKETAERLKYEVRGAVVSYLYVPKGEEETKVSVFLEAQGITVPEAIIRDDPGGIWQQSHGNWNTVHRIGEGLTKHREEICSPTAEPAPWQKSNCIKLSQLEDIEKYTKQIAPTVELIGSLRLWLRRVTCSGLVALATSLLTIGVTKLLLDHPVYGYFVLTALVAVTVATLWSAAKLGRAIFQQPEAWK